MSNNKGFQREVLDLAIFGYLFSLVKKLIKISFKITALKLLNQKLLDEIPRHFKHKKAQIVGFVYSEIHFYIQNFQRHILFLKGKIEKISIVGL